jgi:pheromone shutdown protein TraB
MTVSIDELFTGVKAIIDEYLESLVDSTVMQRSLASPSDLAIRDLDYGSYVDFVGVAHFSRRSIRDAVQAIKDTAPVGICLELCPYRYEYLKRTQEDPFTNAASPETSELVTAVDCLNGGKTDVWLVDMNQEEIAARVFALASLEEARAWKRIQQHLAQREAEGLMLWEEGLKEEAMEVFQGDVGLMRQAFPTLWKVVIVERNIFMACSVISVISHYLERGLTGFKVVLVVGAAHVEGIQQLLQQPTKAFQTLESLGIGFRKPYTLARNDPVRQKKAN